MIKMKIALINDSHISARGDSQLFFDYFMKFFDDVFFPYLKENNIDTIIHAGDLMDRRKFVNFSILNQFRERFIRKLKDENITLHCVLGNHDVYYRNTNKVNSPKELFGNDIIVHENPTVIDFDGLSVALLPWINKENHDECMEFIKTVASPILIGHLELNGYQVMRGMNFSGGLDANIFKRFEQVISGHFHCKQEKDNIYYLGTQYQITFADLDEVKGFHVFDTSNRSLEFIQNPYKMFHTLRYNDESGKIKTNKKYFEMYKDSYVKLYIECKKYPVSFDNFMESLDNSGVAKVTVVEDIDNSDWTKEEMVDLTQDTVTIINNEIDTMNEIHNKDKMKKIMKELYMESLAI
jgi:DNA repair exonuclease SbcCD nuclease subunit